MQYLVLPIFSNSQNAPGVVAGQGYRIYPGNGVILPPALGVDANGYLVTKAPSTDHSLEFRLEALGRDALGYFRLVHLATGKVADVEGKSTSEGARIHLWDWHGGENQQFKVSPAGTGMVVLEPRHSGLRLMVEGASTATGARIVQRKATGATHERWIFQATAAASDRTYVLANVFSGKALTDVGGIAHASPWAEGGSQQWRLEPLTGEHVGSFRIVNTATGNVFSLAKGPYGYGPYVQLLPWTGGPNQRFFVLDHGNGRVKLVSCFNKLALLGGSGQLYEQTPKDDDVQLWQVSLINQATVGSSLKATVYEHDNYQGNSQQLGPGFWNMSQITLINDTISSLRVPPGVRVTLYEHQNFAGAKRTYEADTPTVSTFNDKASSILVELVATLYTDRDFGGASQTVGVGRYNISQLKIGNNTLSSLRVPPGLLVTLFEEGDYKGRGWTYIEDTKWTGALNDKTSSLLVELMGVSAPPNMVRFGARFVLRSHLGKFLGRAATTDLRGDLATGEQFTIIRAGGTKYRSMLAFGDRVKLRSTSGLFVTQQVTGNAILAAELNTADGVKMQTFRVARASGTRHNDLVAQGDTIALQSDYDSRYLVAEASGDANINRASVGSYERWKIEAVTPPPGVSPVAGGSICGAEACAADGCGTAACAAAASVIAVCGTAASAVGLCATDVCGAAGCVSAACGAAVCGADGSVITACSADACGADLCGVAACGAAASGFAVCGMDLCSTAGCGAAATAVGASLLSACGAAVGGVTACNIDVCGANACAINLCPSDACGADFCIVDFIPIVPFF